MERCSPGGTLLNLHREEMALNGEPTPSVDAKTSGAAVIETMAVSATAPGVTPLVPTFLQASSEFRCPTSSPTPAVDDGQEGNRATLLTFPEKLMNMLDSNQFDEAIRWTPDGQAFCLEPKLFVERVLDKHFQGSKLESFKKKLQRYGFEKARGYSHPFPTIAYQHGLFIRGKPELLSYITGGRRREMHYREGQKNVHSTVARTAKSQNNSSPSFEARLQLSVPLISGTESRERHEEWQQRAGDIRHAELVGGSRTVRLQGRLHGIGTTNDLSALSRDLTSSSPALQVSSRYQQPNTKSIRPPAQVHTTRVAHGTLLHDERHPSLLLREYELKQGISLRKGRDSLVPRRPPTPQPGAIRSFQHPYARGVLATRTNAMIVLRNAHSNSSPTASVNNKNRSSVSRVRPTFQPMILGRADCFSEPGRSSHSMPCPRQEHGLRTTPPQDNLPMGSPVGMYVATMIDSQQHQQQRATPSPSSAVSSVGRQENANDITTSVTRHHASLSDTTMKGTVNLWFYH